MRKSILTVIRVLRDNPKVDDIKQLRELLLKEMTEIEVERVLSANLFTILSTLTLEDILSIV